MFHKGTASGNLVEAHMMVNKYWFPFLAFGNGLMQSIKIRVKGSSKAGIGFRGAFGIV